MDSLYCFFFSHSLTNLSEVSGHLVKSDPTRNEEEKSKTKVEIVKRDREPEDFKKAFPSWTEGIWNTSVSLTG